MSLTATEINEAESILNTQGTEAFYDYIEGKGQGYGRLGKGVTNNDSWQGKLDNGFTKSGAETNEKDMSHGSMGLSKLFL